LTNSHQRRRQESGGEMSDAGDDPPPPVNAYAYHANAQNEELLSASGDGASATQEEPPATNLPVVEGEVVIPLFYTTERQNGSVDGRDSHITPYESGQCDAFSDEDDDDEDNEDNDHTEQHGLYAQIWGNNSNESNQNSNQSSGQAAEPRVPKRARFNAKRSAKFDVRHVNCVGCNNETRVDAEEIGEYVKRNMTKCGEEDVYRRAANEWKRIRDERKINNSKILPHWSWKDIRYHFNYCCYDEQIDTLNDIRGVNQLIKITKASICRKNPESGMVTVHGDTFKRYKDLMDLKLKLSANTKRKTNPSGR
jgi:hypothetical protein